MRHTFILVLSLFIMVACGSSQDQDEYIILGQIKGVPDGVKLLLYQDMDVVLDSTHIENEHFALTGKTDRPRRVLIRIPESGDQRMFWLENATINVISHDGSLRTSKVDGSQTEMYADLLRSRKDSLFHEMDRINSLVTESNRDSLFNIYNKMIDREIEINNSFIMEYPYSYESLAVLNSSKERMDREKVAELYNYIVDDLKNTDEASSISKFLAINKKLGIGDKYVDFKQEDRTGQSVMLSDVLGERVTLIEFWASWCGPCRAFNPELRELYETYHEKGFNIVGISLDSKKDNWTKAIESDGISWPNLSDLQGWDNQAAMIYGVRDIPDNFLLDSEGIIIGRYLRDANLKNKLEKLLAAN